MNDKLTVPLREFQLKAGKYLKENKDIILTVYNKPVAEVSLYSTSVTNMSVGNNVTSNLAQDANVKEFNYCKHGSLYGLCKQGCVQK